MPVEDPEHIKAVKALSRAKEKAFNKGWGEGFGNGYMEGFMVRDAEARSNRAPLIALGCLLVVVSFYLGTLVR